jgi:cytochrome c biogenesis protein CcmG/thiol:disulfide interchange protein DsbE
VTGPSAVRRRRRWWRAVALVAVVAVAGFVLAARLASGGAAQPSALVGRPAPELRGTTLDGAPFDLADWRGEVVLVNIWGSWCGPCRTELPLLANAYATLQQRGLHVVGIDVRDDTGTARDFLQRHGNATWPSVQDPDGERAVDWGTFALPETYLVGPDGTVVAKAVGALDARWIDDTVVPLLTGGTR